MAPWPAVLAAGLVIGVLLGLFGVGGSSVATPVLSLLGVSGLFAIASPLPATIPAAVLAAIPYVRSGDARPKAAAWSVLGGVPGTIVGALLSKAIGGGPLLVVSGAVLMVVGLRLIHPIEQATRDIGTERRQNRPLLVAAMFGVGVFTGLLANGGGFLLVPLYLLVFGLRMRQAVGTSLLVIAVLAIPTLAAHWALGHIDWAVAGAFAAGLLPASVVASRAAVRVEGRILRYSFGWFLIAFGAFFAIYRITSL
ncbi:MAG TPA: sulfite exporter TauE/SafE family protein [Acidimicrobiia bacterium]